MSIHISKQICKSIVMTFFTVIACTAADTPHENAMVRIGEHIPLMEFDPVLYSETGKFSTAELADKPAILYFFSASCSASFRRLAQINQVYSGYKDDFDLILIGIDHQDNVQKIYETYREKYRLDIPVTFDTAVYKQYHINAVPHIIWIDDNGIVQAVTSVLDEGYVRKFIGGQQFEFIDCSLDGKKERFEFNPEEPFLVNGNGGDSVNFVQRSVLSKWKIGMPNYMPYATAPKNPLDNISTLQVIGRELADLYRIAYFGRTYAWNIRDTVAYGNYHYSPVLEIADSSQFASDYSLGKNLFCYSQVLPPERRHSTRMMQTMQTDLQSAFGYDVSIETRQMPYLSLVATEVARKELINKGESRRPTSSLTGVIYTNVPIERLINFISYNTLLVPNDLPLINETGIYGNINISLNAIMTDLGDIKTELRKQGLDIVKKQKAMKVIVIKEQKR